jgi:hypothetical protein
VNTTPVLVSIRGLHGLCRLNRQDELTGHVVAPCVKTIKPFSFPMMRVYLYHQLRPNHLSVTRENGELPYLCWNCASRLLSSNPPRCSPHPCPYLEPWTPPCKFPSCYILSLYVIPQLFVQLFLMGTLTPVRLTGGILTIIRESDPRNIGLIIATTVLLNIGLIPLLLSAVGFIRIMYVLKFQIVSNVYTDILA